MFLEEENQPEWFRSLPQFPSGWGWRQDKRRDKVMPQGTEGVYQPIFLESPRDCFVHASMSTAHVQWFFDRGVYAIAQPREIKDAGPKRTIYGLALYPLKLGSEMPERVFHVTLRNNIAGIQSRGLFTGRRAEKCTSSWKESIDFVHVWSTLEQAKAWPHNRKLKAAASGPWAVITIAPQSLLYEDPKSESGGWIFGCDYCVPSSCITDVAML